MSVPTASDPRLLDDTSDAPQPKKCKRSVYLSRPPDPATLDVQHLYSESAAAVNSTKPTYNVKGGEIDLDEGSSHKEDLMAAAWSAGYDRRFWEDPQYAHAETKVMVQRDGYNFEYYLGEGVSLATRLLLVSTLTQHFFQIAQEYQLAISRLDTSCSGRTPSLPS